MATIRKRQQFGLSLARRYTVFFNMLRPIFQLYLYIFQFTRTRHNWSMWQSYVYVHIQQQRLAECQSSSDDLGIIQYQIRHLPRHVRKYVIPRSFLLHISSSTFGAILIFIAYIYECWGDWTFRPYAIGVQKRILVTTLGPEQ